jgi:hypothetical protein
MYRVFYAAIVAGTLSASALARTVPDPKAWAQQFSAVAAHADKDALFTALSSVLNPRITSAQLKTGLETIDRVLEGRTARSSSIIREELLGDAVYRFHLAVHYGDVYYMFYTVDMLHVDGGWEVVNFNFNSDLNKALTLPWPLR